MADVTKIQWAHHTFNAVRGCVKVAPGCKFCYADDLSKRNPAVLGIWGADGTRPVAAEAYWRHPAKWDRAAAKAGERRRVFCLSLGDVFEDWDGCVTDTARFGVAACRVCGDWVRHGGAAGPHPCGCGLCVSARPLTLDDVRARLFETIDATPHLDWLLLTKRPANIRRMWPGGRRENVWLGASVSDQATAERNVPPLVDCEDLAPVRFLSVEPLLGRLDLDLPHCDVHDRRHVATHEGEEFCEECWDGDGGGHLDGWRWLDCERINWVIVGGESGPNARPMDLAWMREVVDDCRHETPVFVKQLGSRPVERGVALELADDKGGDPAEWPEELRVREFPALD